MPNAFDASQTFLPAGDVQSFGPRLTFRRGTIWVVHVGWLATALGLFLWNLSNRTALLTPIGPNFHAAMIGLGVFVGILVTAVEREAWLAGIGLSNRPSPRGFSVVIAVVAMVVASGFAGNVLAGQLWQWQAFHGIHAATADGDFTVISKHSTRSGYSLDLQSLPAIQAFSITCSSQIYLAVNAGDRLTLPVETGRWGTQRVTLPPSEQLHRK